MDIKNRLHILSHIAFQKQTNLIFFFFFAFYEWDKWYKIEKSMN